MSKHKLAATTEELVEKTKTFLDAHGVPKAALDHLKEPKCADAVMHLVCGGVDSVIEFLGTDEPAKKDDKK